MRRAFIRDEWASAAVEFAMVVPVLFAMILGIISTSVMYFSQASLHNAAEWAARYWAVSDAGWTITGTCAFGAPGGGTGGTLPVACSKANTDTSGGYFDPATYAQNHYFGAPLKNLTFSSPAPTTGPCTQSTGTYGSPGFIVTASGTYNFNVMFVNIPVSMSAQACYPLIQ